MFVAPEMPLNVSVGDDVEFGDQINLPELEPMAKSPISTSDNVPAIAAKVPTRPGFAVVAVPVVVASAESAMRRMLIVSVEAAVSAGTDCNWSS